MAQADAEQGVGGREADTLGPGGGGELGEAVVVADDGTAELLPQEGAAAEGVGEALAEVGCSPRPAAVH